MTVAVELTREVDGPEVLEVLAGCGLEAELADGGLEVVVEADDEHAVVSCLDTWITERGLPFVPMRLDDQLYALVPPSA